MRHNTDSLSPYKCEKPSALPILLITAHQLWAQSLQQSIESFNLDLAVTPILVTESDFQSALDAALTLEDGIILVSSLGYLGSELSFAGKLRLEKCKVAIMLICSIFSLPSYDSLLKIGIQGIVDTSASLAELEAALSAVAQNQAETLKHQYMKTWRPLIHQLSPVFLSERERKIIQLLAADSKDQEIAEQLGLEVRTINSQLRYIYAKLGVHSRYGAVGAAFTQGILTPYSTLVDENHLQAK